ncbi:restriction endonuclease subunit S [Mycolicibacterium fortuitum]|uniref:restriction endonuclease subunit S n=1 Tax=Mycolicibacterium fortuitum TaxID=1766 RepID=UPI001CDD5B2B|nr:restriction endonuclease subunit S [Mycolicibacterium fortuitum]UBV19665.1 restriction endonuclease subunit S [Mycolicibacterium fortuitum]
MSWPAYAEYRETDVDWLGPTPSSWSIERMSWLFNDISSGTTPESGNRDFYDGDINWVTTGELRERGISQTDKRVTPSALATYSALKMYPAGALIIAMYGATIGRLGWLDAPACTNQACCVFANPKRVSTRFAYYALSAAREHLILLASGGGQPNINQDKLRSLRIAVPSSREQVTIAQFLDDETAKIDALIAKQEQLIATLREDRTATITQAVTEGLDPLVGRKDSGANLVPAIPTSWSCANLKRLLREPMTYGANAAADDDNPDNPRFVRITDIDAGGDLRSETFRSLPPDIAAPYLLDDGDLLFARSGGTVGKTFLYRSSWGTCCFAGYLVRARVNRDVLSPHFLSYYAASEPYWQYISMAQIQATIQNVSAEKYGSLPVPIPPLDEQRRIVTHLDRQCRDFDALIAKATDLVSTLVEYRSALITDAVTGKIDVRGAA